jgi:hypothetical protein
MNWVLKLLGYRDREYRGDGFSARIEPIMREVVSIVHTRNGASLNLGGERIGSKCKGIEVHIPPEVDADQIPQVVRDLETAFEAMRYGYVIARKTGTDIVPKEERQTAMAELYDMGYDIEILPNHKIRQTLRLGAPRRDIETVRKQTPRIMSLMQSLHGTRPRWEILAKSKEF